jgi:hypothetical protein
MAAELDFQFVLPAPVVEAPARGVAALSDVTEKVGRAYDYVVMLIQHLQHAQ